MCSLGPIKDNLYIPKCWNLKNQSSRAGCVTVASARLFSAIATWISDSFDVTAFAVPDLVVLGWIELVKPTKLRTVYLSAAKRL